MTDSVILCDVSTRDGLQDEPVFVATQDKLAVIEALAAAGVAEIEVTSFVDGRRVPQLADAEALIDLLPRGPRYAALVLNERGYERSRIAFAKYDPAHYALVFVASASPSHNQCNNNRSIDQTLAIFDRVAAAAARDGVQMHGAISCAFVSPYPSERTDPQIVMSIARRFERGGCTGINLADTVGRADPMTVGCRVDEVAARVRLPLSLHLHDASGYALAGVYAGLQRGVRRFEGSLAGLGGCPFAPGATGNLDFERLQRFSSDCGMDTGIDPDRLARARERIGLALANATPIACAATHH